MQKCIVSLLLAVAFGSVALAEAQAPSSPSVPNTAAAIIALVGVILSAIVSAALAWLTARNTIRSEHSKRQSELALKISDLVSAQDADARRAAMRRFAVGIVKVVEPKNHPEQGKVHFIPMNSRVTVGRSDDNDIVLKDKENSLSRWHCGFIANQHSVWIDDYKSLNGTNVGGQPISGSRALNTEDQIEIGPYKLHFRIIGQNTILSQ
jgi:hypothetical protein